MHISILSLAVGKLKTVWLFLLFSTVMFAGMDSCYQIDKKYIDSDLEFQTGVLFYIDNLSNKEDKSISVEFDTPHYIPYITRNDLQCDQDNNMYYCYGDDDGGHITVKIEGDKVYIRALNARLSETTDDPMVYGFRGRTDKFLLAKKVPCFQSKDAIVHIDNFENDTHKIDLIQSLKKLHNIIIYGLDYNKNFAIAVGEDNSIKTRKEQSYDEYHKGIILISYDNGRHWRKVFKESKSFSKVKVTDSKKAVVVGSIEGTGGYIELTEDGGTHWKTVYEGGFINDVTQNSNGFLVAGFAILHSKEGKKWHTVFKKDELDLNVIFSIDDKKVVAAGYQIFYSDDGGKSWHKSKVPEDMYLAWITALYRKNGKLYAAVRHPEGFTLESLDGGKSWYFP